MFDFLVRLPEVHKVVNGRVFILRQQAPLFIDLLWSKEIRNRLLDIVASVEGFKSFKEVVILIGEKKDPPKTWQDAVQEIASCSYAGRFDEEQSTPSRVVVIIQLEIMFCRSIVEHGLEVSQDPVDWKALSMRSLGTPKAFYDQFLSTLKHEAAHALQCIKGKGVAASITLRNKLRGAVEGSLNLQSKSYDAARALADLRILPALFFDKLLSEGFADYWSEREEYRADMPFYVERYKKCFGWIGKLVEEFSQICDLLDPLAVEEGKTDFLSRLVGLDVKPANVSFLTAIHDEYKSDFKEEILALCASAIHDSYVLGSFMVHTIFLANPDLTVQRFIDLDSRAFVQLYEQSFRRLQRDFNELNGLRPIVSYTAREGIFCYSTLLERLNELAARLEIRRKEKAAAA